MMTMDCPHAYIACSTCENSEAAKELRALRVIEAATRAMVDAFEGGGRPTPQLGANLRNALAAWPRRAPR